MWMFSESEPGKRLERLHWNIQDIWNDKAKFDAEKTSNARKGRELQGGKGKTTGVNRRNGSRLTGATAWLSCFACSD